MTFPVVVVVTRRLPMDGSMAEYYGAPEAEQPHGLRPEVLDRQRVDKERAAQRVRC